MRLKKILVCTILIFTLNCFKKPRWETNLTIPLISKTYTVSSLIDTSFFNINNDSTIDFYLTGEFDTIFPIDSIRISDRIDSSFTALSDFVIRNLSTDTIGLDASEITSLVLPDTTICIIIPAFTQQIERNCYLRDIGSILLTSGLVRVTINNNTRLIFDSAHCSLDGINIIEIPFIDSISKSEYTFALENIQLDSIMTFNIMLACHGSGTDSIPISRLDSLSFAITMDSLRIQSGSFRSIPPRMVQTTKTRIYSLPVNYQLRINDLRINSGQLQLAINNQFPFSCNSSINIPEFAFDTSLVITEFHTTNFLLDLTNRSYHNSSLDMTPVTLNYTLEFLLDSIFLSVDADNYYKINYQIINIQIDSIAATFIDTLQQTFSSDTIAINLPDFLSQVQTVNAQAMLEVTNAIAFPLLLNLNIQTKNVQGDSAVLDTVFFILPGTPTNPVASNLIVSFNNLININPIQAVLNANLASFGEGWLNRESFTTVAYTIMSPLQIILRADTIYFDPTQVNIAEDIRDIITNNIDTTTFYAQIQNHIPTRLAGQFIIENQIHDSVNININIPSGIINNLGYVTSPVDTNLAIVLSQQETQIFSDSIINVSVVIYLPDTDTIVITGRDYLKIANSYATIQTQIPPE
jgi:hypothetical protein